MKQSYWDLYIVIELEKDINFKDLNSYLSSLINQSLLEDKKLKNLHEKK